MPAVLGNEISREQVEFGAAALATLDLDPEKILRLRTIRTAKNASCLVKRTDFLHEGMRDSRCSLFVLSEINTVDLLTYDPMSHWIYVVT
jgi:hypothetical protein